MLNSIVNFFFFLFATKLGWFYIFAYGSLFLSFFLPIASVIDGHYNLKETNDTKEIKEKLQCITYLIISFYFFNQIHWIKLMASIN